MKLRIRGNSLRLRLSKSEVDAIGAGGAVEEIVEFGGEPMQQFVYALVPDADAQSPTAVFDSGRLTIFLPKSQAVEWTQTDQTGIEAEKKIDDERSLRILIEKDFACLETRFGDADVLAHPSNFGTKNQIRLNAFD